MGWTVTTTNTDNRPTLEAVSDEARLRSIRWVWHGGRLVDYGLDPGPVVDCISVPYEWASGTVSLEFSVEAFREWIADYYSDSDKVRQAREAVAKA
jgi:hypothetical protein